MEKKPRDISKNIIINVVKISNTTDTTKQFSQFFDSVYLCVTIYTLHVILPTTSYDLPCNVIITVDEVFNGLSRFHNNMSIGADCILDDFLFKSNNVKSRPLCLLFQNPSMNVFSCQF